MKRIIFIYGIIAGVVTISSISLSLALSDGKGSSDSLQWLGYLIMLIALSSIFVAIKRYRDQELGGVIKFGSAMAVGLGIAAVASVAYVGIWEIYLALTDHAFINDYTDSIINAKKAEGINGPQLQSLIEEMQTMRTQYANPVFRLPLTFLEIFPVGLLITIISAAVLRNSKVLPA